MPVYAEGAVELLLALATPAPKGYWGAPVLVWGRPDVGKSTFIESLQRENFPVFTMIASLHDPTDFSGLPVLHNDRMRFAPPDWLEVFEQSGQGILFLDELTTAPPTVQAALLRLVLERKVGAHSLPPQVRIAAAANPPELAAVGWELSPPLANRFVYIQWNLDGERYRQSLESGFGAATLPETDPDRHRARSVYWRNLVAGFLKRNPALAHTQPAEGEYAFASPRSWDFAIALMATCDLHGYAPTRHQSTASDTQPFVNLLKGAVGSWAATSFLSYLRTLRIPDPEAVLDGQAQVDASLREDELFVLFNTMKSLLTAMDGSDSRLSARTVRFLQGAQVVADARKGDSIYTCFRELIKSGWLQGRAAADAQSAAVPRTLSRHFEELTPILEGR